MAEVNLEDLLRRWRRACDDYYRRNVGHAIQFDEIGYSLVTDPPPYGTIEVPLSLNGLSLGGVLSTLGRKYWSQDLNRYAYPEDVELAIAFIEGLS